MDQSKLIKSCIEYIRSNFQRVRKGQYDKCERDLQYILDALQKDIQHKTDVFTIRTANRFWYNNYRQIHNHNTEIEVYNFLLSELEKNLPTESFTSAKKSIAVLIKIVNDGPILNDTGSRLSQNAITAEHCQRNWDLDYVIPEEDIDALIRVATTMPTKQNRDYYKLVVSSNSEFNKSIFLTAIDKEDLRTAGRNTQVDANLLFLYITNKNFAQDDMLKNEDSKDDSLLAVGISSGALALSAAQLNYKTGFCKCFLNHEIKNMLEQYNIKLLEEENPILMVGVGKPNSEHLWNTVINFRKVGRNKRIETYSKKIQIYRI